jgi:hypothetical protein
MSLTTPNILVLDLRRKRSLASPKKVVDAIRRRNVFGNEDDDLVRRSEEADEEEADEDEDEDDENEASVESVDAEEEGEEWSNEEDSKFRRRDDLTPHGKQIFGSGGLLVGSWKKGEKKKIGTTRKMGRTSSYWFS